MTTRTVLISGARGGSGTSTVAATMALLSAEERPTELIARDSEGMAALLGLSVSADLGETVVVGPSLELRADASGSAAVVVIDGGSDPGASESVPADERYLAVRGPCYLALRRIVRAGTPRYDGVILVTEPGRSLRAADVAEVLGLPVVAELAIDPAVARSIDAGVLAARIDRLRPLLALRPLALAPPRAIATRNARTAAVPARPDTSRPVRPISERTPSESSKDLPCPLFSGHGGRSLVGGARIGGLEGGGAGLGRSRVGAQYRSVAAWGGGLLPG
jgi:hypothetical protein